MKIKQFYYLFLFLFILSSCAIKKTKITSQSNKSIVFKNTLDSIYRANPGSIGIMIHIESPSQDISWSGATGYSDKKNKTILEADQPALIASSIKTYISVTILRLVENKKLFLNQPISQLLSKKTIKLFEADGYLFDSITVAHLLSHTSGIKDYADKNYIEFVDKNQKHRWTRDEQLALAVKVGNPLGKPGTVFSYADANYLLTTEIIENISGKPFYTTIRELLKYDELELNNTWFPTLEKKPKTTKKIVHQYWGEYNWDSYEHDISWDLYGGGGIACTTKDLAKFSFNFFNGNIVKNKAIRDSIFTTFKTKGTESHPYYLGLSENSYNGLTTYGHGGFWGTAVLYFPDLNTSISVYVLERDKRKLRKDIIKVFSKKLMNQS